MSQTPNSAPQDALIQDWLQLWNGDFSRADALISSDFHVHAAMLGAGDDVALKGPRGLVGWIGLTRAPVPDLSFQIDVGPIQQRDLIALRWSASGTYAGGFPGAAAPIGTRVSFTGTDLLRVQDGQLAEYWVNSDIHVLLAQLQVTAD